MAGFDIVSQVSHIEANRNIKEAVLAALKAQSARRRISVTDLTSLKQAYFRRVHPEITPSLEKQQAMWSGTGFHELFGAAVSSEEYLEQSVELDGVVGKIDIFEDVPVEVKTTGRLADESDLANSRPSYVEQLGMYCAMTGSRQGLVVIYQREADASPPLSVCRIGFSDLEAIRTEMRLRREALEGALASGDPSGLPGCQWGNRGCDYAAVCDCRTTRARASYAIRDQMASLEVDGIAARQFIDKLEAANARRKRRRVKLNDIVFPRKSFLALNRGYAREDEQEEGARGQLASMESWGIISRVRDSLLHGPGSESKKVPVSLDSLQDMVQLHQGRPAIARLMQLSSLVQRERLAQMSPHYFLRLGFECALTGQLTGRMLLYYPRVEGEDARLMVYDVTFNNLSALREEVAGRVRLLDSAQSASDLPACPEWMCRYCRDAGCADSPQGRLL